MPRSSFWPLPLLALALCFSPGCGREEPRLEIPGPRIVAPVPLEPVNLGKFEFDLDSDEFRGMSPEEAVEEMTARAVGKGLTGKLNSSDAPRITHIEIMLFAREPEYRRLALRQLRDLANETIERLLRGVTIGPKLPEDEAYLMLDVISRPDLAVPRPVVEGLAASNSPWVRKRTAAFLATVSPAAAAVTELTRMLTAERDDSVRATIEAWLARTRR